MGGLNELPTEREQGYLFSVRKYLRHASCSVPGEQQNPPVQLEFFSLESIIQQQFDFDRYKNKPQQTPC